MEDNFNGIEEYRNVFPIDYCKQLIETFEQRASMQLTEHQTGFKNQDERIFMDMSNHNNMFHVDADLCKFFYQTVVKTYEEKYGKKYDSLRAVVQHSPKGMSIQKTRPHQGYHAWHCECADLCTSSRVMAYTLYLNSVEEGGETEFLYQGVKIKPEPGKLVFFPAYYTHPHRGNPIYKGVKYIVSGWYTFDE
jgi:hypothetical protein|tara:strand:+ start:182 stop:757 length:576 start_codon:yes stop_codon:yes gene_type:complete